ncbi:MAG: DUF2635 domain-containing protein [Planctomycetota bacterium]|nr:MAG: DUF2635 domain-containing protein [Planctomycetota bacterium]
MKNTIHIKPCGSLKIRDPHTMLHLSAEGATVPRNSYWLRRLAAGEVEEVSKKTKGKSN